MNEIIEITDGLGTMGGFCVDRAPEWQRFLENGISAEWPDADVRLIWSDEVAHVAVRAFADDDERGDSRESIALRRSVEDRVMALWQDWCLEVAE